MDVKFSNTTSANLDSVSIVNGQIIALSDKSGLYYDLGGSRYNVFPYTVSTAVASGGTNLVTGGGVYSYSAPKSHRSTATTYGQGNASYFGHVKVSDNYISSAGTAASGIAASSYALNTAYSTLDSKFNTLYVTEQGVSGNWLYRKHNTGFIEAWGQLGTIAECTTEFGGLYYQTYDIYLPDGLFTNEIFSANVTCRCNPGLFFFSCYDLQLTKVRGYIASAKSTSAGSMLLLAYVVGN